MSKNVFSFLCPRANDEEDKNNINDIVENNNNDVIGRHDTIEQLKDIITNSPQRFIHIHGPCCSGKKYVVQNVLSQLNLEIFHIDMFTTENTVRFFENTQKIIQIHDNQNSCFFVHNVEYTLKSTMLSKFVNLIKRRSKYIKVFLFCPWSKTFSRNYIINFWIPYPTLEEYLHHFKTLTNDIVERCHYIPLRVELSLQFSRLEGRTICFDELDNFYNHNDNVYFSFDTFYSNLHWIKSIEDIFFILDLIGLCNELESHMFMCRDWNLKNFTNFFSKYIFRTFFLKKKKKISPNKINNLNVKRKKNQQSILMESTTRFPVPFEEQFLIKKILNSTVKNNETSKK